MPVPLIIAIVLSVLGFTVWSRVKLGQGMRQHKDKDFGAFAARLGLTVQAGDPTTHLLYFQQPAGNYQRELRAAGLPYGRPVTVTVMDGVKTSEYLVTRT